MTKAKRAVSAILSAVMMMTTAAAITASADNTVGSMNTVAAATYAGNLTANDAIEMSTNTFFTGIEEYVPGGKLYVPYFKLVANDLLGKEKEITLNDIDTKLENLFSDINDLNDDLRDSMVNITAIQNFDSFHFKTYNSQVKQILSQIDTIKSLNRNKETKYAMIGALIGKNSDIIDVIYDHFTKSSMFSGEAMDKAKPAIDLIMTDYIAGYYALVQCLSAQSMVCYMTKEQKSRIDPCYLKKNTEDQELINKKLSEIKKEVFGNSKEMQRQYDTTKVISAKELKGLSSAQIRERGLRASKMGYCYYKDTVKTTTEYYVDPISFAGKYQAFINKNRTTFINKGKANSVGKGFQRVFVQGDEKRAPFRMLGRMQMSAFRHSNPRSGTRCMYRQSRC